MVTLTLLYPAISTFMAMSYLHRDFLANRRPHRQAPPRTVLHRPVALAILPSLSYCARFKQRLWRPRRRQRPFRALAMFTIIGFLLSLAFRKTKMRRGTPYGYSQPRVVRSGQRVSFLQ